MVEIELHDEVVEWLEALSGPELRRAIWEIDRLAGIGPAARMPISRSLGGGLFELRFTLAGTARRITYRFTAGGSAVLLTTFRKQRQNERAEIARARAAAAACAELNP